MKYKVWDETCKLEKEETCYFRLMQSATDVRLNVVDKNGDPLNSGTILAIDSDFRCLILARNLNLSIPIKSDFEGHVIVATSMQYQKYAKAAAMYSIGEIFKQTQDETEKEKSTLQ